MEKLVEGEDESDGDEFADIMLLSDEDFDATSQDPTKPTSSRYTNIPRAGIKERDNEALKDIVHKLATSATNYLIKDNLLRIVTDAVKKDRESSKAVVPDLISQEFFAHA
ncbi:hypothetical protein Tco_0165005, partial [Tanacetum coccineum]